MSQNTPHNPLTNEAAPKRSRRKEARPDELLEAALDLFVEKGFAATRVDDVAARSRRSEERRVGKECRSRGSPYH